MDTHYKLDFFKQAMKLKSSPSFLCITETKLGRCIDDSKQLIPGYTLLRADRNRRCGGVAICYREEMQCKCLSVTTSKVEHCALSVSSSHGCQALILCCIYRPPKSPAAWMTHFHDLLDGLCSHQLPIVVLGDFNVDLFRDTSIADELKMKYHLVQLITEATHIAKITATLLDHLYCSSRTMISDSDVMNLHLSDHHAVFCNMSSVFQANSSQRRLLTYRRFGRVDCEALAEDMSSQPWSILESSDDVDDITNYFTQ